MTDRRDFIRIVGAVGGGIASHGLAGETPAPDTTDQATGKLPSANGSTMRVALMQATSLGNDQQKNGEKADTLCRQAAQQGADLVVMPEMWNIGYLGFDRFDPETTKSWQQQAISEDGPWVGKFGKLARELNVAIAVTYLQQWNDAPRNAVSLIDRQGKIALTYAKVHTCDFAFEAALSPGDEWPTVSLDTAKGSVKVGAMICFDREFPESARSLMLNGAELVVTPNACLLDPLRIAQFQVRAYENSMAMVMANYPAPFNNGQSVAFDAEGTRLVQANAEEGIFFADIDLKKLRLWRERSLWGNAWRRPHRYGRLTQTDELPIFKRSDAYGRPFVSDRAMA